MQDRIQIDYSRDALFSEQALSLMKYYLLPGESSPQDALARSALAYCYGDFALAQRIYDYASKGWFMYASPVLSNAPPYGEKPKALPISCYVGYVPDDLHGLIGHSTELRWLSVKGGGVGASWSAVRAVSHKAPGPIPFLKTVDADMTAYHQGDTRRGSYAAYLDVSHPDIVEFINFRTPTGGDANRKCFNLHHAVNVTDDFMVAVENDAMWKLKDPHDGKVRDTIRARELWELMLETRFKTGEPYLFFIDAANRGLPKSLQEKGLKIHSSNLCVEIDLPTSQERTAVCCLSSVNLAKFDEWKDTRMVRDLIRFLDNVLQFFIDHAPPELAKAVFSAKSERSVGLGAMGFHTYLQQKNIPFESAQAAGQNRRLFQHVRNEALEESLGLGLERGEAPDMAGTGLRNAHRTAIAPNANSGILLGCSPSIEPIKSNAYVHRTRAGSHLVKNAQLEAVMAKYQPEGDEGWLDEQWASIIANDGSVQHLDYLSDWEKDVFKTALELDQRWVVDHAAERQPYICQGQSVNVFFPYGADRSYVNAVHLRAWRRNMKGLYYLRTQAGLKAENVSQKVERVALKDGGECLACSG